MLQFIKKWHQAFQADKAVRLSKESENETNAEAKVNASDFWANWSDGANDHYEEQLRNGNYD